MQKLNKNYKTGELACPCTNWTWTYCYGKQTDQWNR